MANFKAKDGITVGINGIKFSDGSIQTASASTFAALTVSFNNSNATSNKVVALNSNTETILATTKNLSYIDKIVGVFDANNRTVALGSIEYNGWNWTPEQSLFLGDNGDIVTTSTIDGAVFSLKIGYAISPTKIFVKIGTPVIL